MQTSNGCILPTKMKSEGYGDEIKNNASYENISPATARVIAAAKAKELEKLKKLREIVNENDSETSKDVTDEDSKSINWLNFQLILKFSCS